MKKALGFLCQEYISISNKIDSFNKTVADVIGYNNAVIFESRMSAEDFQKALSRFFEQAEKENNEQNI